MNDSCSLIFGGHDGKPLMKASSFMCARMAKAPISPAMIRAMISSISPSLKAFPLSKWLNRGRGQEAFGRPAKNNSCLGRVIMKPQFSTPNHEGFGVSLVGDQPICAGVGTLLNAGCPPTVTGLVVAVIVNAVHAFLVWTFAHVFKKSLEFQPAVTNLNPPTAISGVVLAGGVVTAVNDPAPNMIDAGTIAPMRSRWLATGRTFSPPASAGFGAALFLHQKPSKHLSHCSAVTSTHVDRRIMSAAARIIQNRPAVKLFPRKIFHGTEPAMNNALSQGAANV